MLLGGIDRAWDPRVKGVVFALLVPTFSGWMLYRGWATHGIPPVEMSMLGAHLGWLIGSGFRPAAIMPSFVSRDAKFPRWQTIGGYCGLIAGSLIGLYFGVQLL